MQAFLLLMPPSENGSVLAMRERWRKRAGTGSGCGAICADASGARPEVESRRNHRAVCCRRSLRACRWRIPNLRAFRGFRALVGIV